MVLCVRIELRIGGARRFLEVFNPLAALFQLAVHNLRDRLIPGKFD